MGHRQPLRARDRRPAGESKRSATWRRLRSHCIPAHTDTHTPALHFTTTHTSTTTTTTFTTNTTMAAVCVRVRAWTVRATTHTRDAADTQRVEDPIHRKRDWKQCVRHSRGSRNAFHGQQTLPPPPTPPLLAPSPPAPPPLPVTRRRRHSRA